MQICKRALVITILEAALASGLKPLRMKSRRITDDDGDIIAWPGQSWKVSPAEIADKITDRHHTPFTFMKRRGRVVELGDRFYYVRIPRKWRGVAEYLESCLEGWNEKSNVRYHSPFLDITNVENTSWGCKAQISQGELEISVQLTRAMPTNVIAQCRGMIHTLTVEWFVWGDHGLECADIQGVGEFVVAEIRNRIENSSKQPLG